MPSRRDEVSDAAATLKLPKALRRDLVILITLKLGALLLLYFLFFSPAHRPSIDVAAHLVGTPLR